MASELRETLKQLRTCFASWQADVRVLGDVRADDAVRALDAALVAQPATVPEGWREFIEECAKTAGGEVCGNNLSARAKALLAAAPSPAAVAKAQAGADDAVCPNCERVTGIRHCQACGCDFTQPKPAEGGAMDEAVADDFRSREHLFPFGLKLGAAAKFLTVHSPKGERPGWGWEAEYSQGKGYGYCSRAEAALSAVREAFRVYHNPIAEMMDQVHDLEQEIKRRDAATAGSGEAVAEVTGGCDGWRGLAWLIAPSALLTGTKLYAGAPPAAGQGEALELTEELRWILGQPNFTCIHTANALRLLGHEIKPKIEEEQAAVIHWCLCLYLKHGDAWREEGVKILEGSRRLAGGEGAA